MSAACVIVVDQLDDGRYRATCPVFPDLETTAATAEEARAAFEEAIGRVLVRGPRSVVRGPLPAGDPGKWRRPPDHPS